MVTKLPHPEDSRHDSDAFCDMVALTRCVIPRVFFEWVSSSALAEFHHSLRPAVLLEVSGEESGVTGFDQGAVGQAQ